MRVLILPVMFAGLLVSAPALAQTPPFSVHNIYDTGSGLSEINGRTGDILATTPSRMPRSRREMNRGREAIWAANPTPTQIRNSTQRALRDGGLHCTIAELDMVGQLLDGTPLVEVACEEDGGLVIANSLPIQATDCFDLADGAGVIGPCRLPKNVAMIEAARRAGPLPTRAPE